MANETILVVDDSAETRQILSDYILGPLGYRVIQAANGEDALEISRNQPVDLLLMDMNMPRLGGLEVLRELRLSGKTLPVVLMTVYGSETVVAQAFRLGVSDYLSKPFTPELVVKTVDRALHAYRLERERSEIERNLVAAETVRKMVITLSHYLNNYLMALNGSLALLDEGLSSLPSDAAGACATFVQQSQESARRIRAVLQVLEHVTQVQSVSYSIDNQMVDIDAALRDAAISLRSQTKGRS